MQKKGSIILRNKGLLKIATDLKMTEKNNEISPQNQAKNCIVKPLAKEKSVVSDKNMPTIREPQPNTCGNTNNNTEDEKLVTYSKWKNELDLSKGSKKKSTYQHELLAFSQWKTKAEESYEKIRKSTQEAFPNLLVSEIEDADDELIEEVLTLPLEEETLDLIPAEDVSIIAYSEEEFVEASGKAEGKLELIENTGATSPSTTINVIKPKNKNSVSLFADISVVILCIFGFIVSLYGFYMSFNRSLDKVNAEPIATITYKYNSAQRKLSDRVLWDRVKQNSSIYNGDLIRTAEVSEATITFKDGTKISLYDQSLAQIFYDDDGLEIDFLGGEIEIVSSETGPGVRLNSGSNIVEIKAGSSLVASADTIVADGFLQRDDNAVMTLQVFEGLADIVSSKNGQTSIIKDGDAVVLDSESATIEKPPITVFFPETNAKYLHKIEDRVSVLFNWKFAENSNIPYTLEISNTNDFSILQEQINITGLETTSVVVGDGVWYWRIYSVDPEKGKSGRFKIIEAKKTIITAPFKEQTYFFNSIFPSVRFVWSEDMYVTDWLLEIADNANMDKPYISQNTTQPSSIIDSLAEGVWYWTVKPSYSEGVVFDTTLNNMVSDVASFEIIRTKEQTPVKLVSPLDKTFIDTTTTQYFSWEYSNEADYYTIKFSKNSDMKAPALMSDIKDNYYMLQPNHSKITDGNWYWTITKTDKQGNFSTVGEIRSFIALNGSFTHNTLSPLNNSIFSDKEIKNEVFSWESNVPYDIYFQVSTDASFESLFKEAITSSSVIDTIALPVGKWYWRIVAKDDDLGLEYASEAKSLFIEHSLESVTLYSPSFNETFIADAPGRVHFSWKDVDNAQYYELRIFTESNLEIPVYENMNIEKPSLSLNMESFSRGAFQFTIRPVILDTISGVMQVGPSVSSSFNTRSIVPVRLISPSDTQKIDGVTALVQSPSIRWSTTEKIVQSQLILSRHDRGLSASSRKNGERPLESQIALTVENPSSVVKLPPLTEGTWYWTLVGQTESGFDVTAVSPYRIIVATIENLPSVQSLLTRNTYDVEYFSSSQFIDFEWQPVSQADLYIFTLRDANNNILFEKNLENETKVRFDAIERLDRGVFTWTVEARRSLPKGITQYGTVSVFTFEVDLPYIDAPHDTTTGDLYGL